MKHQPTFKGNDMNEVKNSTLTEVTVTKEKVKKVTKEKAAVTSAPVIESPQLLERIKELEQGRINDAVEMSNLKAAVEEKNQVIQTLIAADKELNPPPTLAYPVFDLSGGASEESEPTTTNDIPTCMFGDGGDWMAMANMQVSTEASMIKYKDNEDNEDNEDKEN